MKRLTLTTLAALAPLAHSGEVVGPTHAYVIEGSGFFGAPGIELGRLGRVRLSNPSDVTILSRAADDLRFGGADIRPGTPTLAGFENTTNALRLLDPTSDGNTLVDSTGFMDPGVAGMAYSNDGSVVYLTTTVGAFVRVLQVDANDASVISQHNILSTGSVSSLAVVPQGHPTLTPGDLYGLALSFGSSLSLVKLDLTNNTVADTQFVFGIGFSPEFETGLDFASDGTLYAIVQGFDEVAPDVFAEISSHLYTIDPSSGSATDLGVIQSDGTWDAVTLVIDDAAASCPADLDNSGSLNFGDVTAFLTLYGNGDPSVDFDNSGSLNFGDVTEFLTLYAQGCP